VRGSHPITVRWLNAKIAFFEELAAREERGEKLHDEVKRNWKRRRLGKPLLPAPIEDKPTKVEIEYDDDYWARWYARRRKK
jgi:hypothetical protein